MRIQLNLRSLKQNIKSNGEVLSSEIKIKNKLYDSDNNQITRLLIIKSKLTILVKLSPNKLANKGSKFSTRKRISGLV